MAACFPPPQACIMTPINTTFFACGFTMPGVTCFSQQHTLHADLGDCAADEVHSEKAFQHMAMGGSGAADGRHYSQPAEQLRVTNACFVLCMLCCHSNVT